MGCILLSSPVAVVMALVVAVPDWILLLIVAIPLMWLYLRGVRKALIWFQAWYESRADRRLEERNQ